MKPWLQYLIAFLVFCHGFVYVRIGAVLPDPIAQWRGRSWLLHRSLATGQLAALSVALHVAAGLAILACSVAIAFSPAYPSLWRLLAIGGGTVGLAAFAIFWDGQARLLVQEGAIGAVISAVLLIAAIAVPDLFR
jgi:hypothetical protein